MEQYELTMQGAIQVEIVSTIPLPFTPATDTGRLVYTTDTGGVYVGTASEWKRVDTARQHSSGTSYPTNTYAGMLFFKTDTMDWWIRNATNTAWVRLMTQTYPPLDSRDGGTFAATYLGGLLRTQIGAELRNVGNTIELITPAGGGSYTVLSSITVPYVASAGNATYLNGVSAANYLPQITVYLRTGTYSPYQYYSSGSAGMCYANYNDYYNYGNYDNSGGSCFPRGSKILLESKEWINIENIKEGDRVIGLDGKSNMVIKPYKTVLGNRVMLSFEDNSLLWSSEHLLWGKYEFDEYWVTSDYNQYAREKYINTYIDGVLYPYVGLTKRVPIIQLFQINYAHIDGWKLQTPKIRREYGPETEVYSMVVDGSHSYIVNGYVACGWVNDTDFDYSNIKWNGLQI